MTYHFDTEVAKKHGLEEAVIIQNLQFWIQKNRAGKRHKYKGKTWTYNSINAWKELFDFWSESQIRRIINSLIDQGIVVKDNFNQNSYDRTAWYAFKDEKYWLEDFNPKKRQEGYIYVVRNANGNYKIGLSGNPQKRLKSINHEDVIGIFKTKDMFYNEKLLHDRFSKKNIKGEWFSLNKEDIQFIKEWDFDKIKTNCPNDKNHLCKSENGKELKDNSSINTDKKPDNNPHTKGARVCDKKFDKFWEAYDVKKGKVDTKREWQRLTSQEKDDAIKAIPTFQRNFSEPTYYPLPANYLSKRYWEEEGYQNPPKRSGRRKPSRDGFDHEKAERDLAGLNFDNE